MDAFIPVSNIELSLPSEESEVLKSLEFLLILQVNRDGGTFAFCSFAPITVMLKLIFNGLAIVFALVCIWQMFSLKSRGK